jgi:CelD/BcsL family acetyltransferase involved in cellulose biosynthesis
MQTRIVENATEFAALAEPWQALARATNARPFQQFGWAAAWMRTVGTLDGRRLRVITLWDGDKLRAVLPLISRRYRGVRLLEWLGARATDYCDALFDPTSDASLITQELRAALAARGGFDVLRLGQVRDDAVIDPLAQNMAPWVETLQHAQNVPLTWDSGAAWLQSQSKNLRSQVRKREKRLAEAGFEFRVLEPGEPHAQIVKTLLAQKRAWLAARNMPSVLNEPQGGEFFQAVCDEMAKSGALRVSALQSADGKIAACNVSFFWDAQFYSYLSSYDVAMADYGAGSLLRQRLLMWACDRGARVFDLLLGAEAYKKDFASVSVPLRTLVIARGLLGRAARSYYRFSFSRPRGVDAEAQAEAGN